MIRVRGLRKSFGARVILDGIDAEVTRGQIVAIVGPSGGGKSTFLRCLNGLEVADAGEIEIAGFSIRPHVSPPPSRELSRLRSTVGMVFQEFHLFPHLTALKNVVLAQRVVLNRPLSECTERAAALLAQVGLSHRASAYPAEMSGGEKQRIAIARALALPLKVLLLDEPTSALDPSMRDEVRAVLRQIAANANLTMVLVTHEMRLATELAHTIWVIDDGRIAERGTREEMMELAKRGVASQFFARERGSD